MHLRFRSLLTLVALSLLLVGLIACGGGSSAKPDKVLKQTFSGNKRVKSGKLNVSFAFSGQGIQGLNGPVKLSLTGPFETKGTKQLPNFDFSLTLSGTGSGFTAGAVSTGDKGFVKLQGATYAVRDDIYQNFKRGYEQASQRPNGSANNPSLSSLGINPQNWLKNPTNEGDTDVAGTSTTHIKSEIDIPKLLQGISTLLQRASTLRVPQASRVPTTLTPQQQQQIQQVIKKASFDVYSGRDDKILRKLTLDVGFTVPRASNQSGQVTVNLEFADLNKSQSISAPANAKPFSELQSALGGLSGLSGALSALGGGAAGAGGATGSTAAPSAQGQQAYGQCIAAAASDVNKALGCAKLLK